MPSGGVWRTGRSAHREDRGERPAGPGPATALGEPAAAVPGIHGEAAVGRDPHDVDVAVMVEVSGEDRPEDAPAAADRYAATGEPAGAVAAVEVERPGRGAPEEVGLPVAGEVAHTDHHVEHVPAGADAHATTAEPAGAVAAVEVERPGRGPGEQVGVAVTREVAWREDGVEDVPAGSDLDAAIDVAGAVSAVEPQAAGRGDRKDVSDPVRVEAVDAARARRCRFPECLEHGPPGRRVHDPGRGDLVRALPGGQRGPGLAVEGPRGAHVECGLYGGHDRAGRAVPKVHPRVRDQGRQQRARAGWG